MVMYSPINIANALTYNIIAKEINTCKPQLGNVNSPHVPSYVSSVTAHAWQHDLLQVLALITTIHCIYVPPGFCFSLYTHMQVGVNIKLSQRKESVW